MLKDRTLPPDVAQAALDAVGNKRRKAASNVKTPANLIQDHPVLVVLDAALGGYTLQGLDDSEPMA